MTEYRNIVILPAEGCRRSRRVVDYLRQQGIPFTEIPLASPEGQALMSNTICAPHPASWSMASASTPSTDYPARL